MADSKLSGYKSALVSVAWASGQSLVSLGIDEWTDLSDEIDNSTNLYMLDDFELVLGSYTPTKGGIQLFLIPLLDAATYPDWNGNVTSEEERNEQYFVDTFIVDVVAGTNRLAIRDVALPNGKFKFACRNVSGAALPATGSTLKWRPHQFQV